MIRRIAFLGTPQISTTTLKFLIDKGYEVPLVVTGEDKKRGRGSALTPSPVSEVASELGLRVTHQPRDLLDIDFDLAVVVAYGKLISEELLSKGLFVNLHFSLLPRWRGAAPMERAILSGDDKTGVCVMRLVKELDAGPIYQVREYPLDQQISLNDLAMDLANLANNALDEELGKGKAAFRDSMEQMGEPTYAHKLVQDDLRIDWKNSAPVEMRKIRIGRAWAILDSARFKILAAKLAIDGPSLAPGELSGDQVGTGSGNIVLEKVQPENKRAMDVKDWLNGVGKDHKIIFS